MFFVRRSHHRGLALCYDPTYARRRPELDFKKGSGRKRREHQTRTGQLKNLSGLSQFDAERETRIHFAGRSTVTEAHRTSGTCRLLHEEVGRSTMRVVRILVRGWSNILRRVHQILWRRISVEVPVNRMKRQIAVPIVAALRWRAAVTIGSMNHLPARSCRGLAHWASVGHHGTSGPRFLRTLAPHDRCC